MDISLKQTWILLWDHTHCWCVTGKPATHQDNAFEYVAWTLQNCNIAIRVTGGTSRLNSEYTTPLMTQSSEHGFTRRKCGLEHLWWGQTFVMVFHWLSLCFQPPFPETVLLKNSLPSCSYCNKCQQMPIQFLFQFLSERSGDPLSVSDISNCLHLLM